MTERTLEYQPALDGVRALAVVMVLLFHHGFTWMSGGYVGVSVFFTLSGYLITSLLVVEHRATGSVSLSRFYTRRARRLLPAGLLCLALVVAARMVGEFENVPNLRRDVLGSLFQVQNWVKLVGTSSYTELLNTSAGERGPLEHYWSLAIEEQFYWLWPLAVLGMFRLARSWRARRWIVTGLAVTASVAAPVIAEVWGADAAYWSTPARAGEILIGASLSMWMRGQTREPRAVAVPAGAVLSLTGLVAIVGAGVTWPAGDGPAYSGALPVFALASAALVLGLHAASFVRAAFSFRPAVWLGRISYGVYLYHWPVFVLLGDHRTGVSGPPLFLLRFGVTLAVATLSFVLVERPLRNVRLRTTPSRLQGLVLLGLATVVVAGAFVLMPGTAPDFYTPDAERAEAVALQPVDSVEPLRRTTSPTPAMTTAIADPESAPTSGQAVPSTVPADVRPPASLEERTTSDSTAAPRPSLEDVPRPEPVVAPTLASLPMPSRPVRVLVVGDSTATATGNGLIEWAALHPEWAQVSLAASLGCGFIRDTEIDEYLPFQEGCDRLLDVELPMALDALLPDVVVLMVTMRDLEDRSWTDDEGVLTPFDLRYAQRLLDAQLAMVDRLTAVGVGEVVWVIPPRPVAPFQGERRKMGDPARYLVQEVAIRDVGRRRDVVTVVDLSTWMDDRNMIVDGVRRPDGVHFSPEAALEISEQFLAPSILGAALGAA